VVADPVRCRSSPPVSRYALIRRNTYLPTGNVKSPGFRDDGPAASNKETIMASRGKKKTTFAKLNRETKLRERRAEKEARKQARRMDAEAAAEADETAPAEEFETVPGDELETVSAGTVGSAPDPA
jgi:hypothetical protein